MIACLLAAVIQLSGVTGSDLRARAFFDANNVKVGDPLTLTIDFLGSAEFRDLHPPALSKAVSKSEWKIDDKSAKTDTYRDARRLTYRVRPMREGVLYFPALEFGYVGPGGAARSVRANAIPVHAKAGLQVVVDGMGEDLTALPEPPELLSDWGLGEDGDDDLAFAWQKALAAPSAEAFASFDFPAAKLNEATMAIKEGNWARALAVYAKLEWRIGQTREIEKGIIAALALKFDNPAVELPIWRQVGRPVLRHAWGGRLAIVLGSLAGLSFVFWLLGHLIRVLAVFALVVGFVGSALAEEHVEESITTNANGTVVHRKVVTSGNGSYSFSFSSSSSSSGAGLNAGVFDPFGRFGSPKKRPPVKISASLHADKSPVTIGENFDLVLALEMPNYVSADEGIRLQIDEQPLLSQIAPGETLRPIASSNPTNVIQRYRFPMRANAALTNLTYSVGVEYAYRGDSFFFRQTYPYASGRQTARLVVKGLPEEGRPKDFSGIIAKDFSVHEYCDILSVETNDVVTITYKMRPNGGFVPSAYQPKEVAFQWADNEFKRYFVADGAEKTPRLSISYFDPEAGVYKTAETGATPLRYKTEAANQ